VINSLVWLFQVFHGVEQSTLEYGLVPQWLINGVHEGLLLLPDAGHVPVTQPVPWPWTVLTSMFMHGSWLHIIGNMWFLWIFGDNVEDVMGRVKYVIFYLLCGVAAALTQVLSTPNELVPMVGASGAIAGVLGAYLMLFPRARVRCLWWIFILVTTIYVPAWLLLGLWFLSQFLMREPGVASMAHVGGFVVGFLMVRLFVMRRPPPRRPNFPPLWTRA
jgi:membrane associated rhomboid family serine protease